MGRGLDERAMHVTRRHRSFAVDAVSRSLPVCSGDQVVMIVSWSAFLVCARHQDIAANAAKQKPKI
jgi:hypothetical protein